jgi:hypothetical protein
MHRGGAQGMTIIAVNLDDTRVLDLLRTHLRQARALYRRHGFVECPPFGGYAPDRNSVFMSLELRK